MMCAGEGALLAWGTADGWQSWKGKEEKPIIFRKKNPSFSQHPSDLGEGWGGRTTNAFFVCGIVAWFGLEGTLKITQRPPRAGCPSSMGLLWDGALPPSGRGLHPLI